ncbi:hypothetical protein E2C01_041448 [Portunus trituberculatus]|uniref:Uncharacterized protein n=1 Tax=Portunus trituberculatus TaxID=210409 RepID=A0A5B7FTK8_PORTR|nr:hypothetical protein [Portunus trituberculatus]
MAYANFLYSAMADFYKEQQKIVYKTVHEMHNRQNAVAQSEETLELGVSYDGA